MATTSTETTNRPSATPGDEHPNAPQPFLSPGALAARWSMDKKTILSGIHRKEIPCTPIGRKWLIPMAWIEAQESDVGPAP